MKPTKQGEISFAELVKRRISFLTKNDQLQQVDIQNYLNLNKAQSWRLWHGHHVKDTYLILQKLNLLRHPENEMEINPDQLKKFPSRFQNLISTLVSSINTNDREMILGLLDLIPNRFRELTETVPDREQLPAGASEKNPVNGQVPAVK